MTEKQIGTLDTIKIKINGTREKNRFARFAPVVANINDVRGKNIRLNRPLPHKVEFREN